MSLLIIRDVAILIVKLIEQCNISLPPEHNDTLTSLSDELFEQQLALLNEWLESLADTTASLFDSSSKLCYVLTFVEDF